MAEEEQFPIDSIPGLSSGEPFSFTEPSFAEEETVPLPLNTENIKIAEIVEHASAQTEDRVQSVALNNEENIELSEAVDPVEAEGGDDAGAPHMTEHYALTDIAGPAQTEDGDNEDALVVERGNLDPRVGSKRTLEDATVDDIQEAEMKEKWPGWPGETVFRLIVPVHKVGAIIGRKGEFVKKMCEDTRSRIKVVEGIQGLDERVVMVTAREEPDESLPPAVVGLLRVHRQVVEGTDVDPTAPPAPEVLVGSITARLLVPTTQAGSLIGKQGITIKNIQENSGATIRVLPENNLPLYAMDDDRIVEISGAVRSVYLALELALSHLRRFLVDKSVISLFEKGALGRVSRSSDYKSDRVSSAWNSQSQSRGRGYSSAADVYNDPYGSQSSYEGTGQYSSQEYTQQQRAVSLYGREADSHSHAPPPLPTPPVSAPVVSITEVTASLQVPLSYADAVIGANGANILYVRRSSGATVTVQETLSSAGVPEMVVEIRGSTQQVQAAEQLLQSFIAAPESSAPLPSSAYAQTNTAYSDPYPTQYSSLTSAGGVQQDYYTPAYGTTQNYDGPTQQAYGSTQNYDGSTQNYDPGSAQNYDPGLTQSYDPGSTQNYDGSSQQAYGSTSQAYGSASQDHGSTQNYGTYNY